MLDLKETVEYQGRKYLISTIEFDYKMVNIVEDIFKEKYETMVFEFDQNNKLVHSGIYCQRHEDKYEAIKTHKNIVANIGDYI